MLERNTASLKIYTRYSVWACLEQSQRQQPTFAVWASAFSKAAKLKKKSDRGLPSVVPEFSFWMAHTMKEEQTEASKRDVDGITGKLADGLALGHISECKGNSQGSFLNASESSRASKEDDGNDAQEEDLDKQKDQLLQCLENFFSAPEFTTYVRQFVEENSANFVLTGEGEEQPLRYVLKTTQAASDACMASRSCSSE